MTKHQSTDSRSGRTLLFSRWSALICCLVLSSVGVVQAQNPAPSSTLDQLLEALRSNGTLTQQQYDTLKQSVTTSNMAAPQPKPAEMPKAADSSAAPAKLVTFMDSGIGMHIGAVDLTFSGEINAFFVHDRPDRTHASCVLCLASTGDQPNSSVRNGLLPGDFNIRAATHEKGLDIAVQFGFYPGIQSLLTGGLAGTTSFGGVNLAPGNPTGFGAPGIDFRQQFVTIGNSHIGTFKAGRDLGFFGQEAILNDMTLLGAGSTNGNVNPGSVTLGRIGLGYIYTDFMPQISYTTPSSHGLQAAFGIFAPLSDVVPTTLGITGIDAPLTGHGSPQFQGKLTYTSTNKGPIKIKLWTNFITQSMEARAADLAADPALTIPVGSSVRAIGADYGVKFTAHGLDLVATGYNGTGIGTEGLLFLATTPTGHTRDSQGYYVQGTYTFANRVTLGASYGQSHLSLAPAAVESASASALARNNGSFVGQARYGLTKWVNLVGEFTHTRSEGQSGVVSTSDSIAAGPILFF